MPGQRNVQFFKIPFLRHLCLPEQRLLRRTSVYHQSPGESALLHLLPQGHRRRGGSHAQQIVAAAVAASSIPVVAGSLRLVQLGQGVVLAEETDHRPAASINRPEGRGLASQALFHRKSGLFQHGAKLRGRLPLLPRQLRVAVNLQRPLPKFLPMTLYVVRNPIHDPSLLRLFLLLLSHMRRQLWSVKNNDSVDFSTFSGSTPPAPDGTKIRRFTTSAAKRRKGRAVPGMGMLPGSGHAEQCRRPHAFTRSGPDP